MSRKLAGDPSGTLIDGAVWAGEVRWDSHSTAQRGTSISSISLKADSSFSAQVMVPVVSDVHFGT